MYGHLLFGNYLGMKTYIITMEVIFEDLFTCNGDLGGLEQFKLELITMGLQWINLHVLYVMKLILLMSLIVILYLIY